MSKPTLCVIARARMRLMEAHSDTMPHLDAATCIGLCLEYANDDPWIATELAAYEESHPDLVTEVRARRGAVGGAA